MLPKTSGRKVNNKENGADGLRCVLFGSNLDFSLSDSISSADVVSSSQRKLKWINSVAYAADEPMKK